MEYIKKITKSEEGIQTFRTDVMLGEGRDPKKG